MTDEYTPATVIVWPGANDFLVTIDELRARGWRGLDSGYTYRRWRPGSGYLPATPLRAVLRRSTIGPVAASVLGILFSS